MLPDSSDLPDSEEDDQEGSNRTIPWKRRKLRLKFLWLVLSCIHCPTAADETVYNGGDNENFLQCEPGF